MIRRKISALVDWLQEDNYRSLYLSFLRVAIGVWLLKELFISWPYLDLMYGPSSTAIPKMSFISRLFGNDFELLRHSYMWIVWSYIVIIILSIFGIGRWITSIALFIMVDSIQKMNMLMVNGGDVMVRLVILYMIFANSYQHLVLFRNRESGVDQRKFFNLVSNLAALSIMLQLCVSYLSTALFKLQSEMWLTGEAAYYALSMERFTGTPLNKYLIRNGVFLIVLNYAILAFELLFPFFIWFKKFRIPLIIAGVIFHLSIYIFMMLYGFQVIFVLIYGLFFTNKELIGCLQKFKRKFPRPQTKNVVAESS